MLSFFALFASALAYGYGSTTDSYAAYNASPFAYPGMPIVPPMSPLVPSMMPVTANVGPVAPNPYSMMYGAAPLSAGMYADSDGSSRTFTSSSSRSISHN
ncbi:hypothetical protein PAPHI01_0815 [Pancytospora philotis]|nr:hypothetical protein PAPHI01_0815 [Pancytospora philotis]